MENLNDLTKEEKDYYELLVDMLEDGTIDESERNILNKRKNKYQISEERAKELAKLKYLESKAPQFETEGEKDYYNILEYMLEDGIIDESERNILNKRKEKYQISDSRAKELEYFAKKEISGITSSIPENNRLRFRTEGEKDYYNTLVYMLKDGTINESERFILNKRKEEFKISDSRAKELENLIKLNNGGSSYNENNKNSENNEVLEIKKMAKGFSPKNYDTAENENTVDLLENGKAYFNNGEYDKAIEVLKKRVELNPNDYNNWYWLGCSYHANGQYSEAINSFIKTTELIPDAPEYWYRLCISYNLNGQYTEAINSGLKATQINPSYAGNWYWLGRSYHANGQYSKASNCYRKF